MSTGRTARPGPGLLLSHGGFGSSISDSSMHPLLGLFLLGQIQLFAIGFFLPRSQDDDMVIVNRSGTMSQQLRALAALWRT